MAGKPYAPIYDLCLGEAQVMLGKPLDRSRVFCIGDAVATDAKGANDQGLDVLFVASGIHGAETIGPDGERQGGRGPARQGQRGGHLRHRRSGVVSKSR